MPQNTDKYLVDTNSLTEEVISLASQKGNIFVLEDIVDEYAATNGEVLKIKNAGIKILELHDGHFKKLTEVLKEHGDNFDLIRLYSNNGKADVLILAYVLVERDMPDTLFPDVYTIVTDDDELTRIAEGYGIKCIKKIP